MVNLESVTRPQRTPPPGGVLAFFSCSEGEKAYEHSDLKHGVFFHYVIEGLRGEVPVRSELTIRFDYGWIVPWVRRHGWGTSAIAGPDMMRLRSIF